MTGTGCATDGNLRKRTLKDESGPTMRTDKVAQIIRGTIGSKDFSARVLALANRICRVERSVLMVHLPNGQDGFHGQLLHAPHLSDAMAREFETHWAGLNPYPRLVRSFPVGKAFTTDEVMSVRDYRKQPYHGWAERTFGTYELGGVIGAEDDETFAICAGRPLRSGPFVATQKAAMQDLMTRLRPAWFLHRRLESLPGFDGADARALVQLAIEGQACFALTADGTMTACNEAAEGLLVSGEQVCLEDKRLRFVSPRLQGLMRDALAGRKGDNRIPLVDGDAATGCVTVIGIGPDTIRTDHPVKWLVFLPVGAALRTRLRVASFAERHALSMRERDVLALLAAGQSTEDIASALAISVEACRGSMKQILRKSGLSRQAELVVRLLE